MTNIICSWCNRKISTIDDNSDLISHGMCEDCADDFLTVPSQSLTEFLDKMTIPLFLVNSSGLIIHGNTPGLNMVSKTAEEINEQLGGDVMECAYAKLPEGCGKTEHCAACTIRNAVMETFEKGKNIIRRKAYLNKDTEDGVVRINMEISTMKVGDNVFLMVHNAAPEENP